MPLLITKEHCNLITQWYYSPQYQCTPTLDTVSCGQWILRLGEKLTSPDRGMSQVEGSCFNTHWEVCVCSKSSVNSQAMSKYSSTCNYVVTLHVNIHCKFVNLLVDIYIYMINMTIIYIYFNTWGFNSKSLSLHRPQARTISSPFTN